MKYKVTWEMEIPGLDTPQAAAVVAFVLLRDPDHPVTYFTVTDENGKVTEVELFEEDHKRLPQLVERYGKKGRTEKTKRRNP